MSKLRVYLVPPTVPGDAPPKPEELDPITIAAEGDQAKRAARVALEDMGFAVRSINWSPDGVGGANLVSYVSRKGA